VSTVQLVIVCITLVLIVAVVASSRNPTGQGASTLVEQGQQVALHLGDGQSVRGKVVNVEGGVITLKQASLLDAGTETPLGGTARITQGGVTLAQEF
jgi:hypothetical protein